MPRGEWPGRGADDRAQERKQGQQLGDYGVVQREMVGRGLGR